MLITIKNLRSILCKAIKDEVLIVTQKYETAAEIRKETAAFVRQFISIDLHVITDSDGVIIGGYQRIYVMALEKWNNYKRYLPFKGVVFITDKSTRDKINYIGDCKVYLLPIDEGGVHLDGTGVQTTPCYQQESVV